MSFLALAAAIAWERLQPEPPPHPLESVRTGLRWLLRHVNAGGERHAMLAWSLGVLAPVLAACLLLLLLDTLWWPLGWCFEVGVLYLCLGFRRESYRAASVARRLIQADFDAARATLHAWRPALPPGRHEEDLSLQMAETLLQQSLPRLFGVVFWFICFSAPGAVLYFLSQQARHCWHGEAHFNRIATHALYALDWLPARLAAFSFAIVGNFQDALESWRGQAHAWGDENQGILLAAGAGALSVQLGGKLTLVEGELLRPTLGSGDLPRPQTVHAVAALVWRALLLWMAVLALFWLGGV